MKKFHKLIGIVLSLTMIALISGCGGGGGNGGNENSTVYTEYTEIQGGILNEDMILSIENSPYKIVGTLQVDRNVTLTIDPDVKIVGGGIEVFGNLYINGEADKKVVLNAVSINTATNNTPNTAAYVEINYADVTDSTIFSMTGYGTFILRSSILKNTEGLQVWYPANDSYIEKNIFISCEVLKVGSSSNALLYVRNNVFVEGTGIIINDNITIIQNNSFLDTDKIVVSSDQSSDELINVENNFWNTLDEDTIDSMIYDKNDNLNIKYSISYIPFLTEPDIETPSYP